VQAQWDDVLQNMCKRPGNSVSSCNMPPIVHASHGNYRRQVVVLRQLEPEQLVADLTAALMQRIESMHMQRIKLPMAEAALRSLDVWKWCLALQPPILFNNRQLGDIAIRVMALIDVALGIGHKKENVVAQAVASHASSSTPSFSPIRFIISGQSGDGKTLSAATLCLFLQDHFKHMNMASSIIIPVFPSSSSLHPHASDVLKCINHQLRERLPNSFRRPQPPHASLRSLSNDFAYYSSTLLRFSSDAIIVIVIDDVHAISHSVACVEYPTFGYFLPADLNSRVITVVTCHASHVAWLRSNSLAPPSACIVGLKEGACGSDCRVEVISTFAARHLKRLSEAEGVAMLAMASPEVKQGFIRDVQHFRSVFAAAVDENDQFSTMQERTAGSMPLDFQASYQRVIASPSFSKWLGSQSDVCSKGTDNVLFFSNASMSYVRGSCAALESLTPANDVRTVTIVKRMLDAGLADAGLKSAVTLGNCVLAVLDFACQHVSKYIVARIAALVACAPLSLLELRDVLTLDGGAAGELDAGVSAHISHLTSHISHLTSHISHLTSHISHLTSRCRCLCIFNQAVPSESGERSTGVLVHRRCGAHGG
jgi:hypothetical protein